MKIPRSRGEGRVLWIAGALLLLAAGCVVPGRPQSDSIPPRPAPPPRTIDHSQRLLKEIDEARRAEILIDTYGDRMAEEEMEIQAGRGLDLSPPPTVSRSQRAHNPYRVIVPPDGRVYRREVYADPRCRTVIHPDYSPFYDGVTIHRRSPYRRPLPLGNTLFFGTLGGIIGHQSGHRDEGILIGGTLGLLNDLSGW